MKLFFAKCDWYDDFSGEEKTDSCFVFDSSLGYAVQKIADSFPDIFNLSIEEICGDCSDGILYIPPHYEDIDKLKEANMY